MATTQKDRKKRIENMVIKLPPNKLNIITSSIIAWEIERKEIILKACSPLKLLLFCDSSLKIPQP